MINKFKKIWQVLKLNFILVFNYFCFLLNLLTDYIFIIFWFFMFLMFIFYITLTFVHWELYLPLILIKFLLSTKVKIAFWQFLLKYIVFITLYFIIKYIITWITTFLNHKK